MRRIYLFALLFIFVVAFFLRFHKLGEIPNGFYQDESAIGYNAYSILQTGRDEYGKELPLYFKSFGDYKLPVYIYSVIPSIKIFGLNEFAVRFPSALFGFLTVVAFFFFVREISKDGRLAIFATGLLAINPWHLHYSRATFEVSIVFFLFVLGALLLHNALTKNKKGMFFLGAICFIISLYVYNLTRLLSPLLVILLLVFYKQKLNAVSKHEHAVTVLATILLLVPFVLTFFQPEGVGSAKGTLIFSSAAVQAPLLELRSYLLYMPDLFTKFFFNQWVLTEFQYIQNVASYFSVPFFFISGSSHGNHGIGNVGLFYLFELPLIIFGVVQAFRQKLASRHLLVGFGVIVILVTSLTREAPHATRSFPLLVPLIIFSAFGLVGIWDWLMKKHSWQRALSLILVGGFIFYNLVFYFTSYYVRFPIFYAKAWRQQDKPLSLYIKENQHTYEKIIFDKKAGFVYSSLLFHMPYAPREFQETVVRLPDDSEGFSEVASFGKYEFRNIDWSKDLKKGTLIVTNLESKPPVPSVKTFLYPVRPVVAALGQETIAFPVEESAYVLVVE